MMDRFYNLAQNLEGHTLGDWYVCKKYDHKSSTGGFFSIGYEVKNTKSGNKAFLKALEYSSAFNSPNFADILNSMTAAYIFERDLLNKCRDKHLKYVIRILDCGDYSITKEQYPDRMVIYPNINYIVLEMADNSMRNMIELSSTIDYSWILRSLHNTAVAINEMHTNLIAHQDIKPSNVLFFNQNNLSKLGDVGRSSVMGTHVEHDDYIFAGDYSYAPFELLYGYQESDWKARRFSCDMFMFGNLIMTYFNGISLTNAVINRLPQDLKPNYWNDKYENILPLIEEKFSECLDLFNTSIDSKLRNEMISLITQLCCPNPKRRGDLKNSGSQQYSMVRYISKLDLLARKYEFKLKR